MKTIVASFKSRLKTKFAFWTIVIIVGIQLCNSAILIRSKNAEISQDILNHAIFFAELTTDRVIEYYLNYYESGYFKFYDLVDEILTLNQEIKAVYIIETNGTIVFHPEELKERKPDIGKNHTVEPDLLKRVQSLDLTVKTLDIAGEPHIDIVNPYFEQWGKHPYSIRFVFDYRTRAQKLRRMRNQIILISVVSILGGIVLVISLTTKMTQSLNTLWDIASRPLKKLMKARLIQSEGPNFSIFRLRFSCF